MGMADDGRKAGVAVDREGRRGSVGREEECKKSGDEQGKEGKGIGS